MTTSHPQATEWLQISNDAESYIHEVISRRLAGGYEAKELNVDYGALSVAVMTIGLILVVEVVRHKMDHAAAGQVFAQAVLATMYSELTTLGLVEFLLHLISTYYSNLDKQKYYVFTDVHFALFYTAIFYAISSSILAYSAWRIANRLWVQTEMLEVNHYVQIREEFESVTKKINRPRAKYLQYIYAGQEKKETSRKGQNGVTQRLVEDSSFADREVEKVGVLSLLQDAWSDFLFQIRHPFLRRRQRQLWVQIRFHEIRVHFLEAYKLPLRLRVSDYLMSSQRKVLLKLVQISPVAWLMLSGAANFVYYLAGILSYKREKPMARKTLQGAFVSSVVLFLGLALLLYFKMKRIFKELMAERNLWDVHRVDGEERHRLARRQLNLFWGGDPKLVIAFLQFMQFVFALMLSVLVVYWEGSFHWSASNLFFLLLLAAIYIAFAWIAAGVIPKYTMCTSLGQLVDEKTLQKTLASYKLQDAQQRAEEWKDLGEKGVFFLTDSDEKNTSPSNPFSQPTRMANTNSGVTASTDSSLQASSQTHEKATLMAQLVKLDTTCLRHVLPEEERKQLRGRPLWRDGKMPRRRTRSEGVDSMASMRSSLLYPSSDITAKAWQDDSVLHHGFKEETKRTEVSRHHVSRRRCVSDGVMLMADFDRTNSEMKNASEPLAVQRRKTEASLMLPRKETQVVPIPTVGNASHPQQTFLLDAVIAKANPREAKLPLKEESDSSLADTEFDDDDSSTGGLSDNDDVPEFISTLPEKNLIVHEESVSLTKKLRNYLLSKQYILVSNVFGSMIACFLIGQRVESFLYSEGIYDGEKYVSFDFKNKITFWALTAIFLLFLLFDVMNIALVGSAKSSLSSLEKRAAIAATMDFALILGCLIIFFVAETQRCCVDSESPYEHDTGGADGHITSTEHISNNIFGNHDEPKNLHDEYHYESVSHESDPHESDTYESDTHESDPYKSVPHESFPCACEPFGSRHYGGLGHIEPFVSLAALRVFRHILATYILIFLQKFAGKEDSTHMPRGLVVLTGLTIPEHDAHKKKSGDSHGHGHHGGNEMERKVAELWAEAVNKYPDVVAKYGEFSSELLKVMLGIHVETGSNGGENPTFELGFQNQRNFAMDKRYSCLSYEAQEIILASKLGRTVKAYKKESDLDHSTNGSIPEGKVAFPVVPRKRAFVFERNETDRALTCEFVFRSAGARIIRSMRRCDRKLLPIDDKWSAVDVVMTRYEMVCFDASDVDGPADTPVIEGVREAIRATKGGKGLRLCDVAIGRRVVGRLEFSDIESITVERHIPSNTRALIADIEMGSYVHHHKVEYWNKSDTLHHGELWDKIKQDQLRIADSNGFELYLRFYSDLRAAETHWHLVAEDEVEGPMFKNNALQWVQTIGRICGPEQLKQSLPHFGESTDDELRDYLVVRRAIRVNPRALHRRLSTFVAGGVATARRASVFRSPAVPAS